MPPSLLVAIILAMLVPVASAEPACGVGAACHLAAGTYRVMPPPGWDGHTPLPATIHFHGAGGSAAEGMADDQLRADAAAAGVLLILPDGLERGWAFSGGWRAGRDDIAFTRAILADIRARWPIDEGLLFASGFSIGGSMVWHLACQAGLFRAHVAVAGGWWEPLPSDCPAGPTHLLHIHGLADATFPLEGRSLRQGRFVQGNLFAGLATLRDLDGCRRDPERIEQHGAFTLRAWDASCRSGHRLAMALHPGGHSLPEGWMALALDWLRAPP